MKIINVSASNFYSFKELSLDLTKHNGIVRILGNNQDTDSSNGAGKSTIFEAITWGIFGKTIRKSTEDSLVNIQEGSNCSVEINLHKNNVGDIRIVRCKRPTSLNLFIKNKNCNRESASETQKFIEELLETDYKSFLASVVFGQHSDFSFLDSSPEDKRKIIRNCFNLEDLFSKRQSVKEIKSSLTSEYKTLDTILSNILLEAEKVKKDIPDTKYKYVDLPSLKDILDAEASILESQNKIKDYRHSIKKNKDKIRKIEDQLKSFENLNNGIEQKECPVCKSVYTKKVSESDISNLKSQLDSLTNDIMSDESLISSLESDILGITPKISSSLWAKYNEKNKLIENSQKHIDKLKELDLQVEDYKSKISNIKPMIEVMKFWEQAFSEKGLIKYIIRNILDYFNIKCNEYISILTDNKFSITFDEELTQEIMNNGLITKYISLSGGEKRKVNLAIMLALQDLSSKISKTDCNLIFFDEVCDNIDDSGISAVGNLLFSLQSQYPDKLIMVISHNNTLQEVLSESQYITVTKKKGISKLKDVKAIG